MCRFFPFLLFALAAQMAPLDILSAREPAAEDQSARGTGPAEIAWHSRYGKAMQLAAEQNKMMFVFFYQPGEDALRDQFESAMLAEPAIVRMLGEHVCARLPVDLTIRVNGEELTLLQHAAFEQLQGQQGIAILDFVHEDAAYHGCVVSMFPFPHGRCLSVREMLVILDLPPGTPAQRDRVFAARTAPGRPPSDEEAVPADEPEPGEEAKLPVEIPWHTEYNRAAAEAKEQGKMLLIRFYGPRRNRLCRRLDSETLADPMVCRKLQDYVCARLPLSAPVTVGGKTMPAQDHPALAEMLGKPGVAIVDFAHPDSENYGRVVSTFPITRKLWYTPEQMAVILDLPPGTLTQRTLIYAVRTHSEKPASTTGKVSPTLVEEAEGHSRYQARICCQGHQRWAMRFRRIIARLPRCVTAREVCAESWPGENLVEAAVECVRSWRQSPGHWGAVRARHRYYGYDMKRGSNGVWYATGIFSGR